MHLPYQRAMVELTETKTELKVLQGQLKTLQIANSELTSELQEASQKACQAEEVYQEQVEHLKRQLCVSRAMAKEVPEEHGGEKGMAQAVLMAKVWIGLVSTAIFLMGVRLSVCQLFLHFSFMELLQLSLSSVEYF